MIIQDILIFKIKKEATKQTMKKFLLFVVSLVIVFNTVQAQKVKFASPDMKKLTKELTGKNSGVYERLMQRYNNNDTLLSLHDYHLLYYGSALKQSYNPVADSPLRDSLNAAISKNQSGNADFTKIRSISTQILQQFPFDIRTLDPAIYACRMLNMSKEASALEFRMGRIIETIYNSGDGLTEDTPFHIVSTANELDMIMALGFSPSSTSAVQAGNLRYWKVKENEFGVTGFYFKVVSR